MTAFVGAGAVSSDVRTIAAPAGIEAGDLLLCFIRAGSSSGTTTSWYSATGWSQLAQPTPNFGNGDTQVFVRTATAADPSSYAFTWASATTPFSTCAIVAYRTTSGVDVVAALSTTLIANSLTPTLAGDTLVTFWSPQLPGSGSLPTVAAPSGMTTRLSTNGPTVLIADQALTGTSATGTRAATVTGGSGLIYKNALSLTLKPITPPNAPTLVAPANVSTIDRTVAQRFTEMFSANTPGDSQSALDMQWSSDSGTTWNLISSASPNQYVDVASGTFPAGDIEWQMRTYGQTGLVSNWSASSFFTAATPPAGPTITAPTSGSTVGTSTAAMTWSTGSQTAYEVRKVADDAGSPDTTDIYYDTGVISGDNGATDRSVSLPFPVNGRYEHLQLRTQAGGLWSSWVDVRVMVSYTPPPTPTVTAAAVATIPSPPGSTNAIDVTWSTPAPGSGVPAGASADVYISGGPEGAIREATLLPPTGSWRFETPANGVPYVFTVVIVGTNGVTSSASPTDSTGSVYGTAVYGTDVYGS